jgi:hypothetical protein
MITRYYLYAARVPAAPFRLEGIFKSMESLDKYVKVEEDKLRTVAGMQFLYRVDTVQIEE